MRIARSSRLCGIAVSAAATAGAVFRYAIAMSKMAALRDMGESTAGEVGSAVTGTRLWLVVACVMALVTVLVALIPTSDEDRNKA
jgi:hypothetical protein